MSAAASLPGSSLRPKLTERCEANGACDGVELTILMPCLDEAETIAICVQKAASFLLLNGVDGEVLVADNGSTDGSQALAQTAGARIIDVPERGYGSALLAGIKAAQGRYVIMGDADDSYDLTALMPFLNRLRAGADLVMGNRFQGGIAPGAMPRLHRYVGNPVLSFVGRLFFRNKIGDFHCGLRGFSRAKVLQLGLQATGMEFASEIVVKATLARYLVEEVPTTLRPDGRSRPPHLRSWRDGWRHLRFLLLFSPRWLFFYPGLAMIFIGIVTGLAIIPGPLRLGGIRLSVDTMAAASALVVIGVQAVLFAIFTSVYASNEGFLPRSPAIRRLLRVWTLERGIALGTALGVFGASGVLTTFILWSSAGFGNDHNFLALRVVLPSLAALVVSSQLILGTFFLSILSIRRSGHEVAQGLEVVTVFEPDSLPRDHARMEAALIRQHQGDAAAR
jgi:glycosyltransferase involved in cell wall biosynthesis